MPDGSGEGGGPAADAGAVMSASGPVRTAAVALDLPGTAAGLERYRASARRWCAAGVAAAVPAVLLAAFADGFARSFVQPLAVLGALSLLMGAVVPLQARRMRRVLASAPWTAHASVVVESAARGATVVLRGTGPRELLPLTPRTTQWRLRLLHRPDGVLWWCGDPRTGGVLAPSGGAELIRARPVRGRRAHSLAGRPQVRSLLTRPAPPPPQIAAPEPHAAAPQPHAAAREPQPAPPQPHAAAPQESGLPSGAGPAVATRRRPWWRGTFRWLLLMGCLMTALATSWTVAADHDPQVELTVIGKRADGRCDVRWTDPFDGRLRTGPFPCQEYADGLGYWDSGFVVSYAPFKGDLYDAELRGTSAYAVTDGVGLGGLALAVVGLAGGTIRVVRARRLRAHTLSPRGYTIVGQGPPVTGPDEAGAASRPGTPLSCTAFAEEAESQGRLRGRAPVKPAPAGRTQPGDPLVWWRVPALRAVAGVPEALWRLSYGGGIAVLIFAMGPDSVSDGGKVMGVVIGLCGLFAAWRAVASGIPRARLLAAAATAPGPRIRRYALLHDGRVDGPTLVLFTAEGSAPPDAAEPADAAAAGPDRAPRSAAPCATDRPESLLPLLPPGPRKEPWAGLPAPTGTAELRGWAGGQPWAVAWIDGHPYWPQGAVEDIDPAGSPDFGARFGIGPGGA
nr:hypothetical protein OG461_20205 [Streptomyces sp. NBC_00995]